MQRLSHRLLLTVAVCALAASTADAAPRPGISVIGVTGGTQATVADLDQARALHVRLVRVELPWRWIEPTQAGVRDPQAVAVLDAAMQAAQVRGIKVVLLTDGTPCWTSTAPPEIRDGCHDGHGRYRPRDFGAYAELSAFLAARSRTALAALEVWNEPDQANERYWAGPNTVINYAALVKATYPAFKRVAPSVPVPVGAVVGTNGRFVDALFKQGIKGYYDGLSVHFYDLPLLGLRTTRAVQRRYGDTEPLWLLETGANACRPAKIGTEGQPCVTQAGQQRVYRDLFAQTRRTRWLKAIVIYKLRDDVVDRFGVVDGAGRHKPAFATLRAATHRPLAATRLSIHLRRTAAGLRITGSGPDGDFYRLVVRQAASRASWPPCGSRRRVAST